MTTEKKLHAVSDNPPEPETKTDTPSPEELDEEEKEFRALRRDLPGVQGASAVGIVAIGVAKVPGQK